MVVLPAPFGGRQISPISVDVSVSKSHDEVAPAAPAFDGYIRVSRVNGRSGESYRSPGDQRASIERLAQNHKITLDEIVEEQDVSGGKAVEARELSRLVQKIKDGESGGLIVYNVKRYSRDKVDGLRVALDIFEAKGRLIAEDFQQEGLGAIGMLAFALEYAEEERRQKTEGWKRATDGANARGVFVGITPTGFDRNEDGTLRRNADAEAVREVYRGRSAGRSWNQLAADLEAAGVEPPTYRYAREKINDEKDAERVAKFEATLEGGPRWHTNSVRSLVHHPVYKGTLANGVEHYFPAYALVTPSEWQSAQEKQPGSPRRDFGSWAMLPGLVFCDGCGHRMSPSRERRGDGKTYSSYRCQYRACPARARANADELEGLVVDGALDEFARLVSERGVGRDADVEKVTALEQDVEDATRRSNAALLQPGVTQETLAALASEVGAASAALADEMGKSRKFLTVEEARDILDTGSIEQKREAIRRVVLKVHVSRAGTRLKDEFRPQTAEDMFGDADYAPRPAEQFEDSKALGDRVEVHWR